MRKIEQAMLEAIKSNQNWKRDNTEVQYWQAGFSKVLLHGNHIATIYKDSVSFSFAGWQTPTTKSRISCILHTFACHGVGQTKGNLYLYKPDNTKQLINRDDWYTVNA